MDGIRLFTALALVFAGTPALAGGIRVLVPTPGASLPGSKVPVEIEGCPAVALEATLDGANVPTTWSESPYKGRWSTRVVIPPGRSAAGPHQLVLQGLCGKKKTAARILFPAGVNSPAA